MRMGRAGAPADRTRRQSFCTGTVNYVSGGRRPGIICKGYLRYRPLIRWRRARDSNPELNIFPPRHATECQIFSGLQTTTDKPYPFRRQVPPTAYPESISLLGRLETLTKAGAHLYTPRRAPSIGAVQ